MKREKKQISSCHLIFCGKAIKDTQKLRKQIFGLPSEGQKKQADLLSFTTDQQNHEVWLRLVTPAFMHSKRQHSSLFAHFLMNLQFTFKIHNNNKS